MEYYVKFINKTPLAWTLGVYQELPKSPGLVSVAWKKASAARGACSFVKWNVDYGLSLNSYTQVGNKSIYNEEQYQEAKPGDRWRVISDNDTQKLEKIDSFGPKNRIFIKNLLNDYANIGIGIGKKTIAIKEDVISDEDASFVVDTDYYVGLFSNLTEGEVIDFNAFVRPEKLNFTENQNMAIVTARLQGKSLIMDVEYSSIVYNGEALLFDYLPSNELFTGVLSFKNGKGVTCNNVVNYSKEVLRNAEGFCKEVTSILNKEGYIVNHLKTSKGYHLTEGNIKHRFDVDNLDIMNVNITISTENLSAMLNALNTYFKNSKSLSNIVASKAEYVKGCFVLTVEKTVEFTPNPITTKEQVLCV